MTDRGSGSTGFFDGEIFLVRNSELGEGPYTPGQPRRAALSREGLWVGECHVTAVEQASQWHHHANYDSIMYMLSGRIRVDWGAEGEKSFEMGPGDFAFIGRRAIHCAQVLDTTEECRYVFVRIGEGESVINVDGPGIVSVA